MDVRVDVGHAYLDVGSRAASLQFVTPAGTFFVVYSSAAPIAGWAERARRLEPGDSADLTHRFDDTAFRIVRRPDDASGRRFVLRTMNGVWDFTLVPSAREGETLLAALSGDTAADAVPYELPMTGRDRSRDRPLMIGAWLGDQVDKFVQVPNAARDQLRYPGVYTGSDQSGSVTMQFVVEPDGSVRPSSIRMIGRSDPIWARTVRDWLLRVRYKPAMRQGVPVASVVQQPFNFKPR